jgi:hypothetical protein
LGEESGFNVTTGGSNTALGYRAGAGVGATATLNVYVGHESGYISSGGSYNTAIGQRTSSGGFSGSIILGRDAVATANNLEMLASWLNGDVAKIQALGWTMFEINEARQYIADHQPVVQE